MSLKQSIVIKNEFSVMRDGGGTRGSTPGAYLERYVARDDACDPLYPLYGASIDSYVEDYMLRADAVEPESFGMPRLRRDNRDGVAFTAGNPSLSASSVHELSRAVQAEFERGKTVFKTVLSFDDEYLREMGVLDDGVVGIRRGDHRGHVDQMKLREAVSAGMGKLASSTRFDDLLWVGALQFDTLHVHAHLVAVDRGEGQLNERGEQRGMLSERDMARLRRGIDLSLDRNKEIQVLAATVQADRGHARGAIRRYVFDELNRTSVPQLIMAALPQNRSMWRASSHRLEMRRANDVCRAYVREMLRRPESGYDKALRDIAAYADRRQAREGLDVRERSRLVRRGVRRLEEDCMNGVYEVLRRVPSDAQVVATPLLSAAATDLIELSERHGEPDVSDFTFRIRSYAGRMRHHREERQRYHDFVRRYERDETVSEDAKPLIDFYRAEERYQEQLMSKYQSLLGWFPDDGTWQAELAGLESDVERVGRWDDLLADHALLGMDAEVAEAYGREEYGIDGVGAIATSPERLDARRTEARERMRQREMAVRFDLAGFGRSVTWEVDADGVERKRVRDVFEALDERAAVRAEGGEAVVTARVEREAAYEFDQVKALDLHHLSYDFDGDARVSKRYVDAFVEAARERAAALEGALGYLYQTGQFEAAQELPVADVDAMVRAARDFADGDGVIYSLREDGLAGLGQVPTISSDASYDADVEAEVASIVTTAGARFEQEGLELAE